MMLRKISTLVALASSLLVLPAVAKAVETMVYSVGEDGYLPPSGNYSPPWVAVLTALLAVIVILAPAFKNSRRTHLD
jgi:hypothetical protein